MNRTPIIGPNLTVQGSSWSGARSRVALTAADVINNGLALSPTYHRAFANGTPSKKAVETAMRIAQHILAKG